MIGNVAPAPLEMLLFSILKKFFLNLFLLMYLLCLVLVMAHRIFIVVYRLTGCGTQASSCILRA